MTRRLPAFTAALLVGASLITSPSPVQAVVVVMEGSATSAEVGIAPPPCQDGKYNLSGGRWASTYTWSFKASSTPSGLVSNAVEVILQKAFSNITNANNDCGLADNVSATHNYQGTTTKSPNCGTRDKTNVVGFTRLPDGVLGVTCYWVSGGKIVEADMRLNNRESWSLNATLCTGDMPVLEATATHEAGHVFGLDHVGERRHGRLTMSPYLDGPCDNNESTLGKGDVRGLEALY